MEIISRLCVGVMDVHLCQCFTGNLSELCCSHASYGSYGGHCHDYGFLGSVTVRMTVLRNSVCSLKILVSSEHYPKTRSNLPSYVNHVSRQNTARASPHCTDCHLLELPQCKSSIHTDVCVCVCARAQVCFRSVCGCVHLYMRMCVGGHCAIKINNDLIIMEIQVLKNHKCKIA